MSDSIDSLEGNIANAMQIGEFARARSLDRRMVVFLRGEFDAMNERLYAALQQARSGSAVITSAGVQALAHDKIEQFSIRPLPAFPCPAID